VISPLLLVATKQRVPPFNDEREVGRQEVLDRVIPLALKTGHIVKITIRELLAAVVEDDQQKGLT
jgi:hypothetical protein